MGLFSRGSPKPPPAAPADAGGKVYATYIKSLLDYELSRKTVLESKASAVVTTSGVLVTLLFGLVAVVTGAKNFVLPEDAQVWLGLAVGLFVIATALAVTASVLPVPYGQVKFDAKNLKGVWQQSELTASVNVAAAQLQQRDIVRKKNDSKARLVLGAGAAELLALVMLAIAVVIILVVR